MIHTASLVHDDVLDECSLRRGALLPDRPCPPLFLELERVPSCDHGT